MAQTIKKYLPFMGFLAWGDLAGLTMYVNRRRNLVVYPKSPPDKPPSAAQTVYRNMMRNAAAEWKNWDSPLKANWDRACRRLSLKLHGFDLWVYWYFKCDRPTIATIERQSNLQLLPYTDSSSSSSSSSGG
jgi:hypothetical protein